MCVAVLQKQGARSLTKREIENGWRYNSDGGGFAFINRATNKIETYKSKSLTDFIAEYRKAHKKHGSASPFIVHLRLATHGTVGLNNVHPFPVETEHGETYFAHNGIINHVPDDKKYSDTVMFGRLYLDEFPDNWLDNEAIVDMVSDYIGWSKLVFLTTSPDCDHEWYIINPDMGYWDGDNWFSNDSCKPKPKVKVLAKSSYAWDGDDEDSYLSWWAKQDKTSYDDWHAFFPDGNHVLYKMDKETREILESDAEASGHCLQCWHAPCQCNYLCWECEKHAEVCQCGEGPFTVDYYMDNIEPSPKSIHNMTDEEVATEL